MDNLHKLRETITDHDSTATELAEEIGVTRHQIRRWINGESEMGIWKLKKICEYYNVSADYILGLDPNMEWPREERRKRRYTGDCTKYIFLHVNIEILFKTKKQAFRPAFYRYCNRLPPLTENRYRDKGGLPHPSSCSNSVEALSASEAQLRIRSQGSR